jgi:acetyl esterase/lipase
MGGASSLGGAGASTGGAGSGGLTGGVGGPSAGSGGAIAGSGGTAPSFTFDPLTGDKFDEIPIYDGEPPGFVAGAPAEAESADGHITNVSIPTLRRYPMDASKATGWAYLVFPGGGYDHLDMGRHAAQLAERVGPLGVAVIGLKYRCGGGTQAKAGVDAFVDAQRAMRLVRANAAHWGVVPAHLGVVGYSAGSHLALTLAANFDEGDPNAADPIERETIRPAFVGSMSTWSFGSSTSPFTFPKNVPPIFFCHAQDDTTAPIALPKAIDTQIQAQGAATLLDFYETGGHSTCHPGDLTLAGHDWPLKLWPWVQSVVP